MNWEDLKDKHKGERIYVLGASQMMDHINPAFFDGKIVVGCNYVYKSFPVSYTITRHWKVVQEWIGENEPSNVLVHPEYTADLGGFRIGDVRGVTFDDQDLFWSRSISGTAVDFARYLGAREIVILGVECSNDYMGNYKTMRGDDSTLVFSRTNRKQLTDCIELIELKHGVNVVWL